MRKCPRCGHYFKWSLRDIRTIERAEVLKRNPKVVIICPPCGRAVSRTIRNH